MSAPEASEGCFFFAALIAGVFGILALVDGLIVPAIGLFAIAGVLFKVAEDD